MKKYLSISILSLCFTAMVFHFAIAAAPKISVATVSASPVASGGVLLTGKIVNAGGATTGSTKVGFMYGKTDSKTFDQSIYASNLAAVTTGSFTANATFDCGVSYSYYAVASNSSGDSRGDTMSFTAPCGALPVVITNPVQFFPPDTAVMYGTVTGQNVNITTRGFYYGPSLSYGQQTTENGNFAAGPFTSKVPGLSCGVQYHAQAYVVSNGTKSLGKDVVFASAPCSAKDSRLVGVGATPQGDVATSSTKVSSPVIVIPIPIQQQTPIVLQTQIGSLSVSYFPPSNCLVAIGPTYFKGQAVGVLGLNGYLAAVATSAPLLVGVDNTGRANACFLDLAAPNSTNSKKLAVLYQYFSGASSSSDLSKIFNVLTDGSQFTPQGVIDSNGKPNSGFTLGGHFDIAVASNDPSLAVMDSLKGSLITRGINYGTSIQYGSTWSESVPFGTGPFKAQVSVPNATCGTTYHFQAYVTTNLGTVVSRNDVTADTLPCLPKK